MLSNRDSRADELVAKDGTRGGGESLTELLAGYWASCHRESLPDDVVAKAKLHILDTIASGVAGYLSPVGQATRQVYCSVDGVRGNSTVWGGAERTDAASAALCNGTMAHAWEVDDFGGCGHSGAVVVSAAVAKAEELGSSGSDLVVSIVAGYDVASRVMEGAGGYRVHNARGWHSTGTCGTYGAAAAVARTLNLSPRSFRDSLGIAGSYTGGTWAFLRDGAMTKRFHAGKAAETGLRAAELAASGMTGPAFVLEATWGGFLSTYGDSADIAKVTARLGTDHHIMRSGIKAYACCRNIHGSLDAILELKHRLGFEIDDIDAVIVHTTEMDATQLGSRDVRNVLNAQFSLPYSVGIALLYGNADLSLYEPVRTDDRRVGEIMQKISVIGDQPELPRVPHEVEVRLIDGTVDSSSVPYPTGAPEHPLSDDAIYGKARELLARRLNSESIERVVGIVRDLEHLDNVRILTAELRAGLL